MTNEAAMGYMILAAKRAEMDYEYIKCLENLMREEMGTKTEEEAEDAYRKN